MIYLGPASAEVKTLEKLMAAGMNIARLNFSHGEHGYHAKTVEKLREATENYSRKIGMCYPLAIALDTKGPEIRTGLLEGLDELELVSGQNIRLSTDKNDEKKGNREKLFVDYGNITKIVKEGNHVYVDDGLILLKAKKVGKNMFFKVFNKLPINGGIMTGFPLYQAYNCIILTIPTNLGGEKCFCLNSYK